MKENIRMWILSICLCISHSFCSRPITKNDLDDYISRNNDLSFGGIKDIFVVQRSADFYTITYVIHRYDTHHAVYFATYNRIAGSLSDIHTVNSVTPDPHDYIAKEEIENALRIVRSKNVYLLGIDSSQNIYVNPFYANQPPYLMRLKFATGDSIVRKGYVYALYKGTWYLNTHR